MGYTRFPKRQGLYDPRFEHDSCGVGFVCDIKGARSNDTVRKGIEVLERLGHRGAVGADPKTGDGAGILIQVPHGFCKAVCADKGITLPGEGEYGTGIVFMPSDASEREYCEEIFAKTVKKEGQVLLGWRDVPVDGSIIGKTARDTQPVIRQVFIGKNKAINDKPVFERKLYIVRRVIEKEIGASAIKQKDFFYITNLSSRTISYKGLLMPDQVKDYYLDLKDTRIESALALVHSRYSTNTFPTWDLAQPFRFLAHNGEINTLRGNINWFRAGERLLASELFGNDIAKIKPVIVERGSDSATIDNVFELLTLSGRSLAHAMMMLIPVAWEQDRSMEKDLKEFYKYHACLMEPWDGPAAIAFTDGVNIGAILDRNGLRPARYIVTKSGTVIMASEVGVQDIDPSEISHSGRLEPGKMLYIDTSEGRIIDDAEIKKTLSAEKPYGEWNREHLVELDDLVRTGVTKKNEPDIFPNLKAFGYTREDLNVIIKTMAETGKEPIGSMGNDTPHAFLSKRPQMLYDHFKQLFAQVTNPAIDPIREELVMSTDNYIGSGKNILNDGPEHCHKLRVERPIITNEELETIRDISVNGFKTKCIYTLFRPGTVDDLKQALERICFEAEFAIEQGYSFVILSDRGVNKENAALPALLAVSAVHHHLVKKAIRSQISLIVESGEPREVNH
ncbi:MAG: glutamate synthase subunit alpha, partial [Candidatus Omnitrophica bacterium]|nr:glutamate synthase subunit alpha [Candidatus Omnitrophota bacterium]